MSGRRPKKKHLREKKYEKKKRKSSRKSQFQKVKGYYWNTEGGMKALAISPSARGSVNDYGRLKQRGGY